MRAYPTGGESGDRVAPCWMQAPCVPTRRLLEGASPVFRQGAGGWRRATPSLGVPFTTMYLSILHFNILNFQIGFQAIKGHLSSMTTNKVLHLKHNIQNIKF